MKTIVSDIDGVIVRGVIPGSGFLLEHFESLLGAFLGTSLGHRLYRYFRKVNPEVRELLLQVRNAGYRIVLITGAKARHWQLVVDFLNEKDVPYDLLRLSDGVLESVTQFKARILAEIKPVVYLEDKLQILRVLQNAGLACKIVPVRKGKFDPSIILDVLRAA